jgi:hypothetical protein
MRHDASEPAALQPGDLVVIDGEAGVWRVERIGDDGSLRCFSYVDGRFRVVGRDVVRKCPDGTRAA